MKRSRTLKYAVALLVMNVCCLFAAAQQQFHYKATLDSVGQTGFYNIHISPAIAAACQQDLGDIRIKDNTDSIVPFILQQQVSASNAHSVTPLLLIKTNDPGQVILQNSTNAGIHELELFIKNTAASRYATLSGGDDTSHWFVIQENILLANNGNTSAAAFFTQMLHFPYSSYRYFKLGLNNKDVLPINIFKAEINNEKSVVSNVYDTLPKPLITQHDSNKISYIQLQFDKHYKIDKLRFSIGGAKFFNRSFAVYNKASNHLCAAGNITSQKPVAGVSLHVKTNNLLIVINNSDNNPLSITGATAYQLPVVLIAYLDAGKHYSLFFGDSTIHAAVYDLVYFDDSVAGNNRTLSIKNIEEIHVPAKALAGNHSNTAMLWSIIIAVLLLLIYFSYALLKDINRKTTNTNAPL